MKLLRKIRAQRLSPKQEQLAARLAGRITAAQHRAADWLNGKTARLRPGTWLALLVLFCAAGGAYCLYLLIAACN